jgi:hypothetical protein
MLVLVPVAIAWACNPQAHVALDRSSYQPGDSMTVYGSYFPSKAQITVSYPGGSQTVTTSSGGAFTVSGIVVPTQPGSYSVSASRPTGGFAPASFTVASPQPSSSGGSAQQPAPAQTQPATTESAKSEAPAYISPSTTRSQRSGTVKSKSNTPAPKDSAPKTTTAPPAASAPVFIGSTAPTGQTFAASAPAARAPAARTQRAARERAAARNAPAAAAAPSQQTALSDVWSGFEPGRTPSLTTTGAGALSTGTGSALAWGIGLLAVGLFGLVGGLAVAESRRRRVA